MRFGEERERGDMKPKASLKSRELDFARDDNRGRGTSRHRERCLSAFLRAGLTEFWQWPSTPDCARDATELRAARSPWDQESWTGRIGSAVARRFERLARSSFGELPARSSARRSAGGIVFTVAGFPDEEVLRDSARTSSRSWGRSRAGRRDRTANRGSPEPTMVILYPAAHSRCWRKAKRRWRHRAPRAGGNEIGHHFGLSGRGYERPIEGSPS